jgi:hypothetical protein
LIILVLGGYKQVIYTILIKLLLTRLQDINKVTLQLLHNNHDISTSNTTQKPLKPNANYHPQRRGRNTPRQGGSHLETTKIIKGKDEWDYNFTG